MSRPTVTAIICGAGKGCRAGFNQNKLLRKIKDKTILEITISAFDNKYISEIIVTSSPDDFNEFSQIINKFERTHVILGGNTRSESVYNALKETNSEIVLIHDGARPFVESKIILDCISSVIDHKSGICAIHVTDTIANTIDNKITSIPNRSNLYSLQTPQGFYTNTILDAYKQAMKEKECNYTDDSSIYRKFVGEPFICNGSLKNKKLTYKEDFYDNFARVGFGIDTHAFGRNLDYIVLGGIKIPSQTGLIAHSDGDVLVHALMDAMLSGAGLRDIGFYFPDNDPKYKNANSMELLLQVKNLLEKNNLKVKNASIAIHAEKPKLSKYIEDIKTSLSKALSLDRNYIGVGAGTNEGLGYVGEGKGITVYANVLLEYLNCRE